MIAHENFLVEIGTEELPPKALLSLSTAFRSEIEKGLATHNLAYEGAESFATPRRLAVKISRLALRQEDQMITRRGPALAAAFDASGKPTKAASGFAKSCGVDVSALEKFQTDKGEWLGFNADVKGRAASDLLPEIIAQALNALPIPKRMRWGTGTVEFVRPVHWLVMLLGSRNVEATILGITSATTTAGHRFHSPDPIELSLADDYPQVLEQTGFVIASFEQRRELIATRSQEIAKSHGGLAIIDSDLLDEVTALVEWPVPVCGSFDEHFLALPREVLVASMQDHQKYFPMESPNGLLLNKFVTVSNIESTDPDAIRRGNERVIRPRLSDAAFFWNRDCQSRLADRLSRLDAIVFEKRLGSIKDKTDRVIHIATALSRYFSADAEHCVRAATLSRCDLLTDMVGEFPELQGLMGSYYAKHDGEHSAVAASLSEFYMPRFAGDTIPASAVGRCVAYADKLDTLVGIFAIGSAPTGDKDPFALRRAALGCIRIALEAESSVGLDKSLQSACEAYANVIDTDGVAASVHKFIIDRLRGYFTDKKIPLSTIEAVLAVNRDSPADIQRRIDAVVAFQQLPEAATLAAANKRIANILRKNNAGNAGPVNPDLLRDPAEHALADKINAVTESVQAFMVNEDHSAYLRTLCELNDPIDTFFEKVMVMCDDEQLRINRIALLCHIHGLFTRVADIARLND